MPHVRYRTGDLSRWLPGACPCGTVLRSLKHSRGRLSQSVVLRNGRRLSLPDLDEALFGVDGMLDFRARVRQDGGACRLQLLLTAAPERTQDLGTRARTALRSAAALQQSFLDGSLMLESVELSSQRWFTDGVAKRTLSGAGAAQAGPL